MFELIYTFLRICTQKGTYTFCAGVRPLLQKSLSLFAKAYVPNELKLHYFGGNPLPEPCIMFHDQHGGLIS